MHPHPHHDPVTTRRRCMPRARTFSMPECPRAPTPQARGRPPRSTSAEGPAGPGGHQQGPAGPGATSGARPAREASSRAPGPVGNGGHVEACGDRFVHQLVGGNSRQPPRPAPAMYSRVEAPTSPPVAAAVHRQVGLMERNEALMVEHSADAVSKSEGGGGSLKSGDLLAPTGTRRRNLLHPGDRVERSIHRPAATTSLKLVGRSWATSRATGSRARIRGWSVRWVSKRSSRGYLRGRAWRAAGRWRRTTSFPSASERGGHQFTPMPNESPPVVTTRC